MSDTKITLIRDNYDRLGWLGEPTDKPDQMWLEGQTKPFADDAEFVTAYPLNGGSVIVDLKRVEVIETFSGMASAGLPRHSVLVALWYALNAQQSPYTVPDFFHKHYDPGGLGYESAS